MISISKRRHSNIQLIIEYVCASYLSVVLYLSVWNSISFLWIFPVFFVAFMLGIRLIRNIDFEVCESAVIPVSVRQTLFLFLIVMAGQLLYWFAYYPGGFNLDAYGQWDQVHGLIHLNNWHPIFTTGIYWMLTRIIDKLEFCIFVQIVVFSMSIAMILRELSKRRISKVFLWGTAVFVAINPAIAMNSVCLIKDVPFTIFVCWIFLCTLKIEASKGKWLHSIWHIVFIASSIAMLTLVRHNAFFFTVPYILALMWSYKKEIKRIITIALLSVVAVSIFEGPLFTYLDVEPHSNVVGEAIGVPMAAMVNAFIYDPDNCPQETKEFLISIADEESWKSRYVSGEWDSCKWDFGGTELLQDESVTDIVRLFVKTLVKCPNAVYFSIRENTRVVWQVFGYSYWSTWVYIENNDYDIVDQSNSICRQITDKLLLCSETFMGNIITWNIGTAIVLLLVCLLFLQRINALRKSSIILAFLSYTFLTMCLLCGPSHRYFYAISVLILPILAYSFEGIQFQE